MCVVKSMNERYPTPGDIYRVLNYIEREDHNICGLRGATGMELQRPRQMQKAMLQVKTEFLKEGGRQILHLTVSFSKEEERIVNLQLAWRMGYEIAEIFMAGYQTSFAVHDNTDDLHIHFVINSVSYEDGLKYGVDRKLCGLIRNWVEKRVESIRSQYYPEGR